MSSNNFFQRVANQALTLVHREKYTNAYSHAEFLAIFQPELWAELVSLCRGGIEMVLSVLDYVEAHNDYPPYLQVEQAYGGDLRTAHDIAWQLNAVLHRGLREDDVVAWGFSQKANKREPLSAELWDILQINLSQSIATGAGHVFSGLRFELGRLAISAPGKSAQSDKNQSSDSGRAIIDEDEALIRNFLPTVENIAMKTHKQIEAEASTHFESLGKRFPKGKLKNIRKQMYRKTPGRLPEKNK